MRRVPIDIAAEDLSKLIGEIESGDGVLITQGGEPVAMLQPVPLWEKKSGPEWEAASRRLRKLLDKGLHLGGVKFKRDELYER